MLEQGLVLALVLVLRVLSVGLGVGGERLGVVEPEFGVGRGLDARQRPGREVKSFQWEY